MEITKGRQSQPVKAVLYGVAGIGKTTFAAQWPSPLFIDVEQGSLQMDVARVTPRSYAEVKLVLGELMNDAQGFRTIVVDSVDKLEAMIVQDICAQAKISNIEQYERGYGKGWTYLVELWGRLLDYLDRIRVRQGMNILLVGHSRTKHYEPADDAGYDRYTLSMYEKSGDLLKQWSDLTLFARYDVTSMEENGRNKACGNAPRVMHTRFHPCWDAKNRYGLPEKLPFEFPRLVPVFAEQPAPAATPKPAAPVSAPASSAPVAPAATPAPALVAPPAPVAAPPVPAAPADPEKATLLSQIQSLVSQAGVSVFDVQRQVEKRGIVPAGTPLENYNLQTLNRVVAGWAAIRHNIGLANTKEIPA